MKNMIVTIAAVLLFASAAVAQGSIEGTVSDAYGRGLAGIKVTVFDAKGKLVVSVTTDAEGYYSVEDVAAGTYRVGASHNDHKDPVFRDSVRVEDDDIATVDITMGPKRAISTPPKPTPTPSTASTVDEIVALHVAALGGSARLKAVNTIVIEQVMPMHGMEIPTKMFIVIGRSIRSETLMMGNPMVQVVHEGKGWKIVPSFLGGSGEPEDLREEEIAPLLPLLDPFGPLYNYREKGSKVDLLGREKVGDRDMIHLKITTKNGVVTDEYLEAKTYLLYKSVSKPNGLESESIISEYQEVEGIKMPKTIDINSPMGSVGSTTNKFVINGKIDPRIFVKPKN